MPVFPPRTPWEWGLCWGCPSARPSVAQASPWLRPWPEERPRPSLAGQEAQAGLQAAQLSCQRCDILCPYPCRVVPFHLLGASR